MSLMDIDEYFQTNLTNNLSTYLERTINGIFFNNIITFCISIFNLFQI